MKNIYNLLPLFFALIFVNVSCDKKKYAQKEVFCTASPTGDTVRFDYYKPTRIFENCTENLNPSVSKISDSRCPTDVVCVWAGTVSVDMQMDDTFSIHLDIGKQKDTTYHKSQYSFTLVDVIPYPVSQPPSSDSSRKAIVRIIKQ